MSIIIIGTDKNIPIMPQIYPHITSDKIRTRGLRFRLLPVNFGSMIFPMISCVVIMPIDTTVNGINVSLNCSNDKSIGKIDATIDPIVGIKLSRKIRIAQNSEKSRLTLSIIMYDIIAVKKLVKNFTNI